MKKMLRILAALTAAICLLTPAALATTLDEVSAANFAPDDDMLAEGNHGEVDQSAALGLPTVEPLETYPANNSGGITQEDADATQDADSGGDTDMTQGAVYDGQSEGAGQSDDYVDPSDLLPSDEEESNIHFDNDTEPNQIADANGGMPMATEMPVVDVNNMQFSALSDASLGFTFNYPSSWENIPGLRTVCFREVVEKGDYPARIAISVKRMAHTVESDVLIEQLTAFMRTISKQYASDTFQPGRVNKSDTFMGRLAYSNTYLAYSGETEVEGFIIGCAIGKVVVVGHFSATYEDYQSMYNVMRYMINSAQVLSA